MPIDRHISYLEGLPENLNIKKLINLELWDTNRYNLKDIDLSLITFAPENDAIPETIIPEIISNNLIKKNKCTKYNKKYLLYKDDLFYNKYIKYKNKYLKLKNFTFKNI